MTEHLCAGLMSIDDTAEVRERFGYRALIAVGVRDDGTIDVMSHARDAADCRIIGDYAQGQFGINLPRVPFQTWFGWGNGGRPLALSAEDYASLGIQARGYAEANTAPDAAQRAS